MKKLTSIIIIVVASMGICRSQQPISSQDMVAITPVVSRALNIPSDARASLNNKLTQMVTQNGMGSTSGRFALTPNVVTIDKQVTATAPAQYIVELEVSLYVLDVTEQIIIDETSFVVKGVDRLENKAAISAINSINARSPQVRQFMNNVREKIIDYYTTRVPVLLQKADALAEMQQYEEALAVLAGIPDMIDQYPVVADRMGSIYKDYLDLHATQAINEAEAKIAVRDYDSAIDALMYVNPGSRHAARANQLVARIKGTIDAQEQAAIAENVRRWEASMEQQQRVHDDAVMLQRQAIEASRQVGTAKAANESKSDSFAESVNKWFKSKFS